MNLIAKRNMTYSTRRLLAGEVFTAPTSDARVLIALKKAEVYVVPQANAEGGHGAKNATKPSSKRRTAKKDK